MHKRVVILILPETIRIYEKAAGKNDCVPFRRTTPSCIEDYLHIPAALSPVLIDLRNYVPHSRSKRDVEWINPGSCQGPIPCPICSYDMYYNTLSVVLHECGK